MYQLSGVIFRSFMRHIEEQLRHGGQFSTFALFYGALRRYI